MENGAPETERDGKWSGEEHEEQNEEDAEAQEVVVGEWLSKKWSEEQDELQEQEHGREAEEEDKQKAVAVQLRKKETPGEFQYQPVEQGVEG